MGDWYSDLMTKIDADIAESLRIRALDFPPESVWADDVNSNPLMDIVDTYSRLHPEGVERELSRIENLSKS